MKDWNHILERAVRKAEKALGLEISIRLGAASPTDDTQVPIYVSANDRELRGRSFGELLGPPSQYERQVKRLHEEIYRARGREVFRRQKGLCAFCGLKMQGTENTETDHIVKRSQGRDDRIQNLRVVDSACHRERHDG